MILGIIIGLVVGFVTGVLVCRKNKQKVETLLAQAQAELAKIQGK